jgi:hypothetical protein
MGVIVESREPTDLVEAMIRTMKKEIHFDPEISRAQAQKFDAAGQTRLWQNIMRANFGTSILRSDTAVEAP